MNYLPTVFPRLKVFIPGTNQPAVGYKVYTSQAGTDIPHATWVDSSLSVENANPIILDINGEAPVYLDSTLYKFVLKTDLGATVPGGTVDNYFSPIGMDLINKIYADLINSVDDTLGDALITVKQPSSTTVARTQHDFNKDKRWSLREFNCRGNGSADDWQRLTNAFNSGESLEIPHDYDFHYTAPLVLTNGLDILGQSTQSILSVPPGSSFHSFTGTNVSDFKLSNFKLNNGGLELTNIFYGIYLTGCTNGVIQFLESYEPDGAAIRANDCDNIKVLFSNFKALASRVAAFTAPYAVFFDGCSNSLIAGCYGENVDFGFTIVGAGYSGSASARSIDAATGNRIIFCGIKGHTGVSFDINGANGSSVANCKSRDFTVNPATNAYFASFQCKTSTSNSTDCNTNAFSNCEALNDGTLLIAQNCGSNTFNTISGKNLASGVILINGAPGTIVKNITGYNYGTAATNIAQANGISVFNGSSGADIDVVKLTPANVFTTAISVSNTNGALIDGVEARPAITKTAGNSYQYGLTIDNSSDNVVLGSKIKLGGSLYAQKAINDLSASNSTTYPLSFSVSVSAASALTTAFYQQPQRGCLVGKVRVTTGSNITGSPSLNVGVTGALTRILSAASPNATAGNTSYFNSSALAAQNIDTGEMLTANIGVAGSGGSIIVSVDGLPRL